MNFPRFPRLPDTNRVQQQVSMHTIHLQSGDLEKIRFAYSPLLELVNSYYSLQRDPTGAALGAWKDEASRALYGVELVYLNALIAAQRYIADFITPTPVSPQRDIVNELARVYATPAEIVRENVLTVIEYDGESEIRHHFLARPREALDCLMEELRLYWQYTMAHHWERVETVLENDVLYHARQMALHGIDSMFSDLSTPISYSDRKVVIKKPYHDCNVNEKESFLNGRGLQLVPMVFSQTHAWHQIVPHWQPMLMYGARGMGLWYRPKNPEPDKALRLTLGTGRAKVLLSLLAPAHTTELAQKLNLTSGAISQHLQRLSQAGLVESHRNSHHVYYRLTARGENLVRLFTE
jgi:DNA-binding HxlR family transcriptional regulator